MNKFSLINHNGCFDIHRENYEDIKNEMRIFVNEVLSEAEACGQDTYSYSYLYRHSFDVLRQILDEYFAYNDHKLGIK